MTTEEIITQAKIEENIHWLNRAHFMAAKKHEERIAHLMKGGKHGQSGDHQGIRISEDEQSSQG